jgi:hypothetical protein
MPSTASGPVHPFGLRSTIIGHRGRRPSQLPSRAASWIRRISAHAVAIAAATR